MPAVNTRDLKRKIRAVGNIKKITRAMQMVSASKLKKVQERLMTLRPYSDKITGFLQDLAGQVKKLNYPLFQPREKIRKVGVVAVMADKGLCGSYNSNMARFADKFIADLGKPVAATAIGRKAVDFFRQRSVEATPYIQLPTEIPFSEIKKMTQGLVEQFESGGVDEVHLLFTRYVNALTFKPGSVKFLPIEPPKHAGEKKAEELTYEFEPEPAKILDRLIPRYVEVTFHRLLLESMSSEHAARMNAMRNATDSASDLITSLTLMYNKARQAGITKELSEIVSGAEALK